MAAFAEPMVRIPLPPPVSLVSQSIQGRHRKWLRSQSASLDGARLRGPTESEAGKPWQRRVAECIA
jgi:hypothetical protein